MPGSGDSTVSPSRRPSYDQNEAVNNYLTDSFTFSFPQDDETTHEKIEEILLALRELLLKEKREGTRGSISQRSLIFEDAQDNCCYEISIKQVLYNLNSTTPLEVEEPQIKRKRAIQV